jgi:hypothetical protein
MFHFLADHNFNGQIVKGLLQRTAGAQILQARDAGLSRTPDPALLEWAAANGCLVLTHDVNTLVGYAYERVAAGQSAPGVFVVPQTLAVGRAIENLVLVVECSEQEEWQGLVHYLPLRT